jgi:hypothetical protein
VLDRSHLRPRRTVIGLLDRAAARIHAAGNQPEGIQLDGSDLIKMWSRCFQCGENAANDKMGVKFLGSHDQ